MDALKGKLLSLENSEIRKKISLITELLPAIADAQQQGYKLKAIYAEVNNHIPMPYSTFQPTLYRARKAQKHQETRNTQPGPVADDNKSSRTEVSKNKLAEFKKGNHR